jgi:hypothetical protein
VNRLSPSREQRIRQLLKLEEMGGRKLFQFLKRENVVNLMLSQGGQPVLWFSLQFSVGSCCSGQVMSATSVALSVVQLRYHMVEFGFLVADAYSL